MDNPAEYTKQEWAACTLVHYWTLVYDILYSAYTDIGIFVTDDLDEAYRRARRGLKRAVLNAWDYIDGDGDANFDLMDISLDMTPETLRYDENDEPVDFDRYEPINFDDFLPEIVKETCVHGEAVLNEYDKKNTARIGDALLRHERKLGAEEERIKYASTEADALKYLNQQLDRDGFGFVTDGKLRAVIVESMNDLLTALSHGLHLYATICAFGVIEALLAFSLQKKDCYADAILEYQDLLERRGQKSKGRSNINDIGRWNGADVLIVAKRLAVISEQIFEDCYRLKDSRNALHLYRRIKDRVQLEVVHSNLALLSLNEVIDAVRKLGTG